MASEYAKQNEEKHKRKIILPCVIPWEYGSNRYASQKGMQGFGTSRCAVTKIESTKELSESNDGVVPWVTCPDMRKQGANQSGSTPFGGIQEHVRRVQEADGKKDMVLDPKSERFLSKWAQPNPTAKNDDIGRRRDALTTSIGGRRFTHEENTKSHAAIPILHDPRNNVANSAFGTGAGMGGYHSHRQVTTEIEGLDRSETEKIASNLATPWMGGSLAMQSQSKTGGFQKPRDVANSTYYDEKPKR
uniref:Uncharacterized protein n=1 Tax=Plectus sambesii TaxID=2011161 RepID=A0A914WN76_9BILA